MLPEDQLTGTRNRWKKFFIKSSDILLLTGPLWAAAAAAFVYLSVIFDWVDVIPWLCLAIAFTPFILRLRHGRPGRRTPFDIPILFLLGGMIMGVAVSDHFHISLGTFQTFLVAVAFYYSMANYPKLGWLVLTGLFSAFLGGVLALAFAAKWASEDVPIPHGLAIALVITGAIALGMSVFARQNIARIAGGIIVVLIAGAVVLFADESLHNFLTLVSIEGRMRLWIEVLTPIEGSSLWTGLGLGDWGFSHIQERIYWGHVHNAYLELYINTGVAGLVALAAFMAAGAKLAADILYSPRNSHYYGFGAGVILASLAVLALGFLESAPLASVSFTEATIII